MNTVIFGAGLTGLTCAWKLSESLGDRVVLIEKEEAVGGLIRTIHRDGYVFDLGSHRIHELFPEDIFKIISDLCEDSILKNERNGQLFTNGQFIKYPPSIPNILLGFGIKDFIKLSLDYIIRFPSHIRKSHIKAESYEVYMISLVGRGIYERLFKPYALKLWGIDPRLVAPNPAESRNSNLELPYLLKELLWKLRKGSTHYYYYPRDGMGSLAEGLKKRFLQNGGRLLLSTKIEGVKCDSQNNVREIVIKNSSGKSSDIPCGRLISTINPDGLLKLLAAGGTRVKIPLDSGLSYRSLRLLYMETDDSVPCQNETFYFPEPQYTIGRVSELSKYSPILNQSKESTVLTIEIPCTEGDPVWSMPDKEIFERVKKELIGVNRLQGDANNSRFLYSFFLRDVYPVYRLGWKPHFLEKYDYLNGLNNLFQVGRNALYLHCNMDHCMLMALRLAAQLIEDDSTNTQKEWLRISEDFFKFRLRY
ncbi:protoporphyrinogen/coproporphyrinogen oxidase [Acidobacteriota bacterium]